MPFYKLTPLWIALVLLTVPTSLAQQSVTTGHEERDAGISLYKQSNTASAIKALKNAVKKDKLDAEAWHYLGLAYNAKGDPKNARKAFEEVVRLRPNFIEARTGLAYSLLQLKKFTEAFVAADWVLKNKPDEEVAHYVIGVIYLRKDSYSSAAQHADAALKSKPDFPHALLLKSQALYGLYLTEIASPSRTPKTAELIKDAASALEQYIRSQPNDKDIAVWRDQLETMRSSTPLEPSEEIFKGSDVTTKAIVKSKPEPMYTERARSNGVTGTVVLRVVFAADGTVRNIRAVKGLPDGLTQVSIAAARKIKFVPATKDGKPVSMYIQLEYNFHLY